jgi:molecular chaperone GrpE
VLALALKSVPAGALTGGEDSKTPQERLAELHTGVELTQRSLLATLFKYHVKPFDPTGKTPGSVIDCQKMGYTIKDRVLRAAQVGVAQDTS